MSEQNNFGEIMHHCVRSLLATLMLGLAGGVQAADTTPIPVAVAAQPVAAAINELSRQSGLHIVIDSRAAEGITSTRVDGTLTAEAALAKLLENTGLEFEYLGENVVTVVKRAKPIAALDSEPQSVRLAQAQTSATDATSDRTPHDTSRKDLDEVRVMGHPYTEGDMDIVRSEDDAQPYQIIKADEIQKTGALDVEDFLKKHLSMNTVAQVATQQSASVLGGRTTINLRGIGTNQTLILINGRRSSNIASFGGTYQPDIKSIPIGAIERIEVLPVSSSAIYGGSAIGGVINVVLKHDYEGGQVGISYRSPFDVNAPVRTVDASYGSSLEDGKTHIMVGARYSDSQSPSTGDRPQLYQRGLNTILSNNPSALLSSGDPYLGGTTPNIGSSDGSNLVLKPAYGGTSLGSPITSVPAGTSGATSPLNLGARLLANAGAYNFLPVQASGGYQGLGRDSLVEAEPQIGSVLGSVRRRMTDGVEVFLDSFVSRYRTNAYWTAYNNSTYGVPASSPINPFQQDVTISLPANPADEKGISAENDVMRLTGGIVADLPYEWQLESDYTWNRTDSQYQSAGQQFVTLPSALAAGTVNPFVDTLANPLNLNYYGGTYGADFPSQLGNAALRVAGPVGHLPAGNPMLTIGLERREESMLMGHFFRSFSEFPTSNLDLYYLPKSQTVLSAYTELKVPLVSPANGVPLVNELELQLAGRTEHFKVSTGTTSIASLTTPVVKSEVSYSSTNPTIGLRFKPFEQLMLRASYATGFLPPDYTQFLAPQLGGTDVRGSSATTNVIDPLRGQQVTAVQVIAGGNPAIKPQTSTSWGVGLVWTPQYVEGLRANLEWYRLDLKNVATTPTAQQIVNFESQFPGRVQRNPVAAGDPYGVGQIKLVDYSLINATKMQTQGTDLSLAYRVPVQGVGTFEAVASGTAIRYFKRQTTLGGELTDIVNQVANGGPLKRRANAGLSWMRDGWKVDWTVAHYGSYDQYDSGGVTTYVLAQGSAKIPSQTYHDVVFEYGWSNAARSLLSDLTLQFGINNVFGKVPPVDVYYNISSYYSPFGDPRLREFWLALNKRF